MTGRIRIRTLSKLLGLYNLTRDRKRRLTYREVMQEIGCCRSNSYNYLYAIDKLVASMLA
ncbi:hypothetical protein MUP77_06160 [Candidatus Bathyarchaeota archaeon]|nr:hypothetical protein [Candidatus Bathyarchaeota archaeon]